MKPVIGITCALQKPGGMGPVPTSALPIYHVSTDYCLAVEKVDAIPLIIPMVQSDTMRENILENIDGLIVTGGGGSLPQSVLQQPYLPSLREQNPERYAFDSSLIKKALRLEMPLVGICRGNQMINEVTGGTIYSRLQTEIPGTMCHNQEGLAPWGEPWHPLILDPESALARIFGTLKIEVNSLHHQSIHKVGKGLKAVAYAPDGVVEAIESEEHPFVFGLQFHPEKMMGEPFANNFFRALREAALAYKKAKGGLEINE